jgi:hypothetical protein
VKSAQSFVSDGPEGVGTHRADVAAGKEARKKISDCGFPISDLCLGWRGILKLPRRSKIFQKLLGKLR